MQKNTAQQNMELVSLLSAISIVSKRLAENLKRLSHEKEGEADADKSQAVSTPAGRI